MRSMTTATRQAENPQSIANVLPIHEMSEPSVEGIKERAARYRSAISKIMKGFDQRIGTEDVLKQFFGKHAEIARLQGPIRLERPTRRKHREDPVYVNGYVATRGNTFLADLSIPPEGIFVGFIEKQSHTIPEEIGDKLTKRHVLVPQHWGVISVDNLTHRPYAMDSRLTGRPTSPIAPADNLLLHEGLDPAHAGWEKACEELESYLSNNNTVKQAQEVMRRGIYRQVNQSLNRYL